MQCVILHGAFGNIDENWFPWLKKSLVAMGHEVFLEQYPVDSWDTIEKNGKNNTHTIQNLISWTNFFEKNTLPRLNKSEGLVFFGHSLSPVFTLHLVLKFNLQLKGVLFASPFLEALNQEATWHFDVVNRTFYKKNFDWQKLKLLVPHSFVLYGDDDPYVPNHFPIDFAHYLQSTVIPVKNGGHLGSNFKEFPLLLDLFKKISE